MLIHPLFGYVLGHDGNANVSIGWVNTSYALWGFVPRKEIKACGVAFRLGAHNPGDFSATIFAMYGQPLWTTPEQNLDGAYSRRVISIPSKGSAYRCKIEFPDVNLAGGCQYYVSLKHTSPTGIIFYHGPYAWPERINVHPFNYAGLVAYNTGLWGHYSRLYNAQILYRMPDGTAKAFEPLLTGDQDLLSTSDLRVRFSIPDGLRVRVDGVVLSRFTSVGSPGPLKVRLLQGGNVLTESDYTPSGFTPPTDIEAKQFYLSFLDSVLLSPGIDYDLQLVVSSPNNSTNRYLWQVYNIDTTDLHSWWTYRMVIGGTENPNVVPAALLFSLDIRSPFS